MLEMLGTHEAVSVNAHEGYLIVDLSKPCTVPVVGFDALGNRKQYFLKVTERKGLVLV